MNIKPARLALALILLAAPFFLSACVTLNDPESAQENRADIAAELAEGQSIGQSFRSRRSPLNSVQLFLSIAEKGAASQPAVRFELFRRPGNAPALVSKSISFSEIEGQFPVTISFPGQHDPPGQLYLLRLSTNSGLVQAYGSQHDSYTHGELWAGEMPQAGDLSFRLGYDYNLPAMLKDALLSLSQAWLILPLLATLWLPGNLLLTAFSGKETGQQQSDGWQNTALSIGLSLAVIPIFILWTTTFGFRLNRAAVYAIFTLLLALKAWQCRACLPGMGKSLLRQVRAGKWPFWTLWLIFLVSLGIRLAMTRDLAAPAWVDSVHHATLVRLILEYGAYPDTYQPLIPSATASYHAGYHAVMAIFTWLSGLELPQSMLIFGQVLNAACVILAYQFTIALTGNRTAAVLSGLICGVFTPMPAYLASWGRYTHLAGMLILPAAYTFLGRYFPTADDKRDPASLEPPGKKAGLAFLAAICAGGLFLTHYQVLAFLACLLLVQVGVWLIRNLWRKEIVLSEILRRLAWLATAAVASILLSLPWWPPALQTLIIPRAAYNPTAAPFSGFNWGYLTSASGTPVLILAGLGLAAAVLQLRWFATITYLWIGLLFLLANLGALGLPCSTFVNHISVEIALFLPVSACSGFALAEANRLVNRFSPAKLKRWLPLTSWLIAIPLTILGAQRLTPILNPVTLLARQGDLSAMQWIEKNVPEQASVLINPFSWGYGIYAGNDGGFWITPLAGRKTIPPPILYGLGENLAVITEVTEFTRQAIELSKDPPSLYTLMQAKQVDYLYCGVRGGVFDPTLFQASPLFEEVFAGDGVWIFKRR